MVWRVNSSISQPPVREGRVRLAVQGVWGEPGQRGGRETAGSLPEVVRTGQEGRERRGPD